MTPAFDPGQLRLISPEIVLTLSAFLILGLSAGVTVLSVGALRPPPQSDLARAIRNARSEAIRKGKEVEVDPDTLGAVRGVDRRRLIRFLPDGRAIRPGVDPWTGALVQENEGTPQ